MSDYARDLRRFNEMYGMPAPLKPAMLDAARIRGFIKTIRDEVTEGEEILSMMTYLEVYGPQLSPVERQERENAIMVAMADWLGDLQVYAGSEMVRWGLPVDAVLNIIMQSNFSKMGADGKPVFDEHGKLLKGPNYWKPEPKLAEMLHVVRLPTSI